MLNIYIKLKAIMDNKANLCLLKDVQKFEFKPKIKIFTNFPMHYYSLKHKCSFVL